MGHRFSSPGLHRAQIENYSICEAVVRVWGEFFVGSLQLTGFIMGNGAVQDLGANVPVNMTCISLVAGVNFIHITYMGESFNHDAIYTRLFPGETVKVLSYSLHPVIHCSVGKGAGL